MKYITTISIILTIILMVSLIYLNQEVPACVDSPTPKPVNLTLNHTVQEINQVNEQLESNVVIFQTSGQSMNPLIRDNQRCLCVKSKEYKLGDIVVFFANFGQGFEGIAHKIVSINNSEITTQGVNNNFSDQPIKQENILCSIPFVKRYELR